MHDHSHSTTAAAGPPAGTAFTVVRRISKRHAVAGLVLLWLASGVYLVPTEQQAVLTTFGAIAADQVTPGVGWHWPWPMGPGP